MRSLSLLLPLFLLAGGLASGAEPIVPPPGGKDVIAFNEKQEPRLRNKDAEASGKWVQVAEIPSSSAYHVDLVGKPKSAKDVQLNVPIKESFEKGDVMLLSFWVRRPKSGGEPGPAAIYAQAGVGLPRYEFRFSAYRQWQQHVRSFVAPADFDRKKANVSLHLGGAGPAIEVAGLQVLNYGPDFDIASLPKSAITYKGREADAAWRKDALERIETIRKADLAVEVVDADGKPVKDAEVSVRMQRHAFGFGNAVNAHLLGAEESEFPYTKKRSGVEFTATWQDALKYREVVAEHFNAVTFESELRPHVWKQQTGDNPVWKRRYQVLMEGAMPWLQEQEIDVRGHYLAWAAMDYNALEKEFVGNPEGHRQWLWAHMADVLPKTNDFVTEWDTINHIIAWGKHTYEKEYGGLQIHADIMKEARRLAPQARHAINEGKVLPDGYKRDPYKRVIRFLNEQGQAPDAVGFMAHFALTSLTPPEELLEVYDDFGEIAPRLQLSELDVEAGDDEQLQADYFRDVMIASFSHPKFVSIVQWGFWENAHWKPDAALWRADWSLKPSGKVFVDLVKKQWWTDESARTDAAGQCQVRGFLGDYEVRVVSGDKIETHKVVLDRDGGRIQIRLGEGG